MSIFSLAGMSRVLFSVGIGLIAAGLAVAQNPEQRDARVHEAPTFHVETNVVTVTVVVRDRKGQPVGNLEKKDFRLFDEGKPQEITGFRVETAPVAIGSGSSAVDTATEAHPLQPAVIPHRFVALFFDDLHLPIEDVTRTRAAAWRYVSTSLQPEDRIAVFTSSTKEQLDFTSDRDKLHDTLFRLTPHSRTNPLVNRCPAIEEYQAYLIHHVQDTSALEIATAEGYECHCKGEGTPTGDCWDNQRRQAGFDSAQIWDLADMQSLLALEAIDKVVRGLAARPGKRLVVLVSPGFLSMTRTTEIDALITRALHQNVVINAIDAAGLYTRTNHAGRFGERMDLDARKNGIENQQLEVARDVLANLSAGTGGKYFRNSNDFDQGFREAAQAPQVYYVLSFSPQNAKLDGKFHALKVAVDSGSGFAIQARRGYFANPPAASAQNAIGDLVFSDRELQSFPASVSAQPAESGVTVKIHVDAQALQFRKDSDRYIDTLTFNTALFDRDGKYVEGKESSLDLRVSEAKLEQLRQSGINASTGFHVGPGVYRIREVIRESETNSVTTVNGSVEVKTPASTSAPKQ